MKDELLYELENHELIIQKKYIEEKINEKNNFLNAVYFNEYFDDILVKNYFNKEKLYNSYLNSINIEILEKERIRKISQKIFELGGISEFEYRNSINNVKLLKEKKEQAIYEYEINKKNEIIEIEYELKNLTQQLSVLEANISKTKIVAPINGHIEIINPINENDILIENYQVAKIIPFNNKYKVKIMVIEKDINKIKIGNKIKYYLTFENEDNELELTGKVELIYEDIIYDNANRKYYFIEGSINNEEIKKLNLKKGMSLECRIIVLNKRIFNFLLEKLEFKTKNM